MSKNFFSILGNIQIWNPESGWIFRFFRFFFNPVSNFWFYLLRIFLIFQVLDLPYERMPPRKDAPVTPEDTGSAADGDSAKANNSNG